MLSMSVSHLVPMELRVRMFYSVFTACWHRPFVSVLYVEVIIDIAAESLGTVEPRSRSNKDAAGEPLRPIVSIRRTRIWSVVVVTVRTDGSRSDAD
jgi:hypothetical protein